MNIDSLNAGFGVPKRMVPIIGVVSARTIEEFGALIKHEGERNSCSALEALHHRSPGSLLRPRFFCKPGITST